MKKILLIICLLFLCGCSEAKIIDDKELEVTLVKRHDKFKYVCRTNIHNAEGDTQFLWLYTNQKIMPGDKIKITINKQGEKE